MNMFIVSAASYFKFLQILVKQLMESKSEDLIYNHSINSLSLPNQQIKKMQHKSWRSINHAVLLVGKPSKFLAFMQTPQY